MPTGRARGLPFSLPPCKSLPLTASKQKTFTERLARMATLSLSLSAKMFLLFLLRIIVKHNTYYMAATRVSFQASFFIKLAYRCISLSRSISLQIPFPLHITTNPYPDASLQNPIPLHINANPYPDAYCCKSLQCLLLQILIPLPITTNPYPPNLSLLDILDWSQKYASKPNRKREF